MKVRELSAVIEDWSLCESSGATPWETLSATLQRRDEFVRSAPGTYDLRARRVRAPCTAALVGTATTSTRSLRPTVGPPERESVAIAIVVDRSVRHLDQYVKHLSRRPAFLA